MTINRMYIDSFRIYAVNCNQFKQPERFCMTVSDKHLSVCVCWIMFIFTMKIFEFNIRFFYLASISHWMVAVCAHSRFSAYHTWSQSGLNNNFCLFVVDWIRWMCIDKIWYVIIFMMHRIQMSLRTRSHNRYVFIRFVPLGIPAVIPLQNWNSLHPVE